MRRLRWLRTGLAAGAQLARRPWLWATALRQLRRLARPGWWHRPPFLPVPDRRWLAFRMRTAYGDATAVPPPADLVAWLAWCRQWDRLRYPRLP